MDKYTGYYEWHPSEQGLEDFYSGLFTPAGMGLVENQYLIIYDSEDKVIDKYFCKDNEFEKVHYMTLQSDYCGVIKPRNVYQELAIHSLMDRRVPVKVLGGVFGSGKDLLMSGACFSFIEKGIFEKLVYIRPNITLEGVPDIGYLKGGMDEKLEWTLAPLWDKFGGREATQNLVASGKIELVALPFIKGRSFENSIIYVSEGQNITRKVAGNIISRAGEGTEIWINGDYHSQTDRRMFEVDNGMRAMEETLKGNTLYETIYLPITERSAVAQLAGIVCNTEN